MSFIFLLQYLNIVCKNIVFDVGLRLIFLPSNLIGTTYRTEANKSRCDSLSRDMTSLILSRLKNVPTVGIQVSFSNRLNLHLIMIGFLGC